MMGGCPNFQGGKAGNIRENGLKTGNSLAMQSGKWTTPDQNFGKSPLLSISRDLTTIILNYKKLLPKK